MIFKPISLIIALILPIFTLAEWKITLEYSLNEFTNSYPLGSIEMSRAFDGNYTGTFKPAQEQNFGQKLFEAQNGVYSVRARSSTQPGQNFLTTSDPCLFLHSNLFHVFWLSISQEKQQLHTLTIFPDTVAWRSDTEDGKYHSEAKLCKDRSANVLQSTQGTPKGVCHVVGESVLPTPDTAAFVQKMEREKRAKQHGADADNRSFLAKYWMYIVPVVLFAVISSAVNPEAGAEGAAQ
ncbi:ER membrane protein complex subunit 10 [Caenorhabditis elegans]|uniref:ER membrane protein complex subunit 10 n=1 Tax=Caenorhabditis elegans TaxID=6239 RepID=Q9XWP1_CAEEL|nr:ER membrane protein complex subunit 10 [Caenorhabditis elegans]CAA21610.1 ER membrane protein complex subunit 10 [Caenorhabditis elegans]|eukprot:NP_507807.1 Uncharacterized protein CELE_Y43F8C.7 [Caenorhabditis elegans]